MIQYTNSVSVGSDYEGFRRIKVFVVVLRINIHSDKQR
jgi:hypothetical protein